MFPDMNVPERGENRSGTDSGFILSSLLGFVKIRRTAFLCNYFSGIVRKRNNLIIREIKS
jgi:hypothetical protein